MFRNVANEFRKLVNPAWTFIRSSHCSPVWLLNKETILCSSMCEIPKEVLERIKVKNLFQSNCNRKKMTRWENVWVEMWISFFFLYSLEETGTFSLAMSNTGRSPDTCCHQRRHLVTAKWRLGMVIMLLVFFLVVTEWPLPTEEMRVKGPEREHTPHKLVVH